jgi:hypothetical protein
LAATAERAVQKFNCMSRQLEHSNGVEISPSKGNPQRSQKGGLINRTLLQHLEQTKPDSRVAR